MEYFTAFGGGRKRGQRDKVKLSLRHIAVRISCMCTNRFCGVGEMRRREREKRRVGERRGDTPLERQLKKTQCHFLSLLLFL